MQVKYTINGEQYVSKCDTATDVRNFVTILESGNIADSFEVLTDEGQTILKANKESGTDNES